MNKYEKKEHEAGFHHRNYSGHSHDFPEPEQIKEIFNIISNKVPGLLKELSSLLYGPDSAKNYAQAAATFYKELRSAGMDNEQAFELTQQYMSTLNLGKVMKNFGH